MQLLNYPVSHSLTMTPPGASSPSFVAKLIEDDVPEDRTSKNGRTQVPTFHGCTLIGPFCFPDQPITHDLF